MVGGPGFNNLQTSSDTNDLILHEIPYLVPQH